MQTWHYIGLACVTFSSLLGGYVALMKSQTMVNYVEKAGDWFAEKYATLAQSEKTWLRQGVRWLLWPNVKVVQWSQQVSDPFQKAGIQAAGYSIGVFAAVGTALLVAYALFVITLVLIAIVIGFWLLGTLLGSESNERPAGTSGSMFSGRGTSHRKTDFFGDGYVEHRDEDGRVIGRSRTKTDFFGDRYVEHSDKSGQKVGTSITKKDLFGDTYVKHTDSDGNNAGTTRKKTDFWGDSYASHEDAEGRVVAESRRKTDWFGDSYEERTTK